MYKYYLQGLFCNDLFLLEEKRSHWNIYSGMSQAPDYKLDARL